MVNNTDIALDHLSKLVKLNTEKYVGKSSDICLIRLSTINRLIGVEAGIAVFKQLKDLVSTNNYIAYTNDRLIFPIEQLETIQEFIRSRAIGSAIDIIKPTSISNSIDTSISFTRSTVGTDAIPNAKVRITVDGIPQDKVLQVSRAIVNNIDDKKLSSILDIKKWEQHIVTKLAADINNSGYKGVRATSSNNRKDNIPTVSLRTFSSKIPIKTKEIISVKSNETNWLNLVTEINTRLPQKIISLMHKPRLQNRTGRFAYSAEADSIQLDNKDNVHIGFSYAEKPYGVFDPSFGHRGLATAARNPKKLISDAIRAILKELAYTKFKNLDGKYQRFYIKSKDGYEQTMRGFK